MNQLLTQMSTVEVECQLISGTNELLITITIRKTVSDISRKDCLSVQATSKKMILET